MTDSKARVAEPSLFQGLVNSPVREATRRATRHFCFNLLATGRSNVTSETSCWCNRRKTSEIRIAKRVGELTSA